MAKLHQIVAEINNRLTQPGGQFDSKRFQKGRFNGIAELVVKKDGDQRQTMPVIFDDFGDETVLTTDDTFPFELYHRHIGSTISEVEADFGDREIREETANMLLVVIGDRTRLKLNKEEIITGINLGMPVELGSAFLSSNSLFNLNIIQGDFNLNREEAWNAEYNTEDVMLKANQIFFTLNYQVVTQANTECIEVCN